MAADDLESLAQQAQKQLNDQKKAQQQAVSGFEKLESQSKDVLKAAQELDELSK